MDLYSHAPDPLLTIEAPTAHRFCLWGGGAVGPVLSLEAERTHGLPPRRCQAPPLGCSGKVRGRLQAAGSWRPGTGER